MFSMAWENYVKVTTQCPWLYVHLGTAAKSRRLGRRPRGPRSDKAACAALTDKHGPRLWLQVRPREGPG